METTDKEEILMALMSNLKNTFPTNKVDKDLLEDNPEMKGEEILTKAANIEVSGAPMDLSDDNIPSDHQVHLSPQESQILALKQWSMYVASVLSCMNQEQATAVLNQGQDDTTQDGNKAVDPQPSDEKTLLSNPSQDLKLQCLWLATEGKRKHEGVLGDGTTVTLQDNCDFCHYHSNQQKSEEQPEDTAKSNDANDEEPQEQKDYIQVGFFRLTPEQHQGLVTILKHSGALEMYHQNVLNLASKAAPLASKLDYQGNEAPKRSLKGSCPDQKANTQECGGKPTVAGRVGEGSLGEMDHTKALARLSPPRCTIPKLPYIELILRTAPNVSNSRKESIANFLDAEDFVPQLVDLYRSLDPENDSESLNLLYSTFRSILMMDKPNMVNIMFANDHIHAVIDCFKRKADLSNLTAFEETGKVALEVTQLVLMTTDVFLVTKIHQSFWIQFCLDNVLPRTTIHDDASYPNLVGQINSNREDILRAFQEDDSILQELFMRMSHAQYDLPLRKLSLRFIRDLLIFIQHMGFETKDRIFSTMDANGFLNVLEVNCLFEDPEVRHTAVEALALTVVVSPTGVRKYMLDQSLSSYAKEPFLLRMIEEIKAISNDEYSAAEILTHVIKGLLDPHNSPNSGPARTQKGLFVSFFYERAVDRVIDHFAMEEDQDLCASHYLMLDLLTFCVTHHTNYIKSIIIEKNIISSVSSFTRSRQIDLALGGVRFLRRIIGCRDELYNKHIVETNALEDPVLALEKNKSGSNMMNSALVNLFHFIKTHGMFTLATYLHENFSHILQGMKHLSVFEDWPSDDMQNPADNVGGTGPLTPPMSPIQKKKKKVHPSPSGSGSSSASGSSNSGGAARTPCCSKNCKLARKKASKFVDLKPE